MNESLLLNITQSFGKALSNVSSENQGITEGIIEPTLLVLGKIAEILVDTGQNYGFWKFLIVLFAIIGFFAILSAIGSKIFDGLNIILKIFVILPLILLIGFSNRKKRKERLTEWGEIKKDFKENSRKIKKRDWILWIFLRLIIPLIIVLIIIWRFFLE